MENEKLRQFRKPDFSTGEVEFRVQNEEVCLYSTRNGLRRFIHYCENLLEKNTNEHIHLEDYELLTNTSMAVTVGVIDD